MLTSELIKPLRLPGQPHAGWIGVDVGARGIKLVQVESGRNGPRIARARAVEFDPHAVASRRFRPSEIRGILPQALSGWTTLGGAQAACSLPMEAVVFRTVRVPGGEESETRELIAQELPAVEGAAADCEFDFWEVGDGKSSDSGGMSAFSVVAVSRALAGETAAELLHAGLRCESLDALPFANARAAHLADPAMRLPQATLDWGYATAMLTVSVDGGPVFARTFRGCGLEPAVTAVANELGLSHRESAYLLTAYGLPHPERPGQASGLQQVIESLIHDTVSRCLHELQKTLDYLNQQKESCFPERVWLLGGGATIRNIADVVQKTTGAIAAPWKLPGDDSGDPEGARFGTAAALSALAFGVE